MMNQIFERMIAARAAAEQARRSMASARFVRGIFSPSFRKSSGRQKAASPKNDKLLAKFATLSPSAGARADLRRASLVKVNQANQSMARKERRQLARAYAAGAWREICLQRKVREASA